MGALVAQLVKRLPIDLAVPGSYPALGDIFSTVNGVTKAELRARVGRPQTS